MFVGPSAGQRCHDAAGLTRQIRRSDRSVPGGQLHLPGRRDDRTVFTQGDKDDIRAETLKSLDHDRRVRDG